MRPSGTMIDRLILQDNPRAQDDVPRSSRTPPKPAKPLVPLGRRGRHGGRLRGRLPTSATLPLERHAPTARASRPLPRRKGIRGRRRGPPLPGRRGVLNMDLLDAGNLGWKLTAASGAGHRPRPWTPTSRSSNPPPPAPCRVPGRRPSPASAVRTAAPCANCSANSSSPTAVAPAQRHDPGFDLRYPMLVGDAERHPLIGRFAPDLALRTPEGATAIRATISSPHRAHRKPSTPSHIWAGAGPPPAPDPTASADDNGVLPPHTRPLTRKEHSVVLLRETPGTSGC
jgi:hypothetical protein